MTRYLWWHGVRRPRQSPVLTESGLTRLRRYFENRHESRAPGFYSRHRRWLDSRSTLNICILVLDTLAENLHLLGHAARQSGREEKRHGPSSRPRPAGSRCDIASIPVSWRHEDSMYTMELGGMIPDQLAVFTAQSCCVATTSFRHDDHSSEVALSHHVLAVADWPVCPTQAPTHGSRHLITSSPGSVSIRRAHQEASRTNDEPGRHTVDPCLIFHHPSRPSHLPSCGERARITAGFRLYTAV